MVAALPGSCAQARCPRRTGCGRPLRLPVGLITTWGSAGGVCVTTLACVVVLAGPDRHMLCSSRLCCRAANGPGGVPRLGAAWRSSPHQVTPLCIHAALVGLLICPLALSEHAEAVAYLWSSPHPARLCCWTDCCSVLVTHDMAGQAAWPLSRPILPVVPHS